MLFRLRKRPYSLVGLLVLAMFLVWDAAHEVKASPTWGTVMPGQQVSFVGVQHYRICGRTLESGQGQLRSAQNFLTWNYGLREWLSLDLKWSAFSTFEQQSQVGAMEYPRSVWGGGYGLRLRVYDSGAFKSVLGFQHFSVHPAPVKTQGMKESGILEDWQFSGLMSYDMKKLVPYFGVRWVTLDYIHFEDKERSRIKTESSRRLGVIVGAHVLLGTSWGLNGEVDFQDQGSFTGGVYHRF